MHTNKSNKQATATLEQWTDHFQSMQEQIAGSWVGGETGIRNDVKIILDIQGKSYQKEYRRRYLNV